MLLVLTASVAAAQDDPQGALARALKLADLYNWAGAGPYFKAAEEGFRRAGDERNAMLAHLGVVRATVEQDQKGLPAVSAELADALESNELLRSDRRLRLFALVVKGDIDTEVETASMKADWSEVLTVATELGDAKWRYRAEAQLGLAAFYEADVETARSNVSAAVIAAQKAGDSGALIRYLSATGLGAVETGNPAEALPYFEQALKVAEASADSGYPFFTQESKMAALLSLDRKAEAEALARDVLDRARAGGRRSHEVHALRTLAGVQIAKGNAADGLRLLDEAIAVAEQSGLLRVLADVQTMKAGLLLKAGRLGQAQVAAEAASRASQESGDLWSAPRRYQLVGDLQRQQGDFAASHETYQTGEEFVDALVGKASTLIDKQALIRGASELYKRHVSLIADELKDPAIMFTVIEQVRGRVARDLLAVGARPSEDAKKAEKQISRLRLRLMSARSRTAIRMLRDEIFIAEQARWTSPGLVLVGEAGTSGPSLAEVERRLGSRDVALTFVMSEPHSYCLVTTRRGSRIVTLESAAVIRTRVARYLKQVQARSRAIAEGRELYRLLLQPIGEVARAGQLVITRDAELYGLPFEALVRPQGTYVLEGQVVEYTPSMTTRYLQLQGSRSRSSSGQRQTAALAVGGVPYAGTNLAAGEVSRGYRSALLNLPASQDEAFIVRDAYGANRAKVLAGRTATEAAFTGLDLSQFGLIHMAVHGLANSVYPDRAALVLLSDKAAGADGFLQSAEIVQLKLNADLVVLSACDSAAGAVQGQEGVATLGRSFLLAGARAVVASLWAVDDKSSLYLMRRFYRRLASGETISAALAGAKREMLADFGPNAVPANWASFTVEGLGGSRIRAYGTSGAQHGR